MIRVDRIINFFLRNTEYFYLGIVINTKEVCKNLPSPQGDARDKFERTDVDNKHDTSGILETTDISD